MFIPGKTDRFDYIWPDTEKNKLRAVRLSIVLDIINYIVVDLDVTSAIGTNFSTIILSDRQELIRFSLNGANSAIEAIFGGSHHISLQRSKVNSSWRTRLGLEQVQGDRTPSRAFLPAAISSGLSCSFVDAETTDKIK